MGICTDNNYKIRRDGVIFLKEYLQQDKKKIIESERWCDIYLPLLMDFLKRFTKGISYRDLLRNRLATFRKSSGDFQ